MTKIELATAVEVTGRLLSNYENGSTTPKAETVERIAEQLSFPVEFFYRCEAPLIQVGAVSFRSLVKTPARQRDSVAALASLAVEVDQWVASRFTRPNPDLPELDGLSPSAAADVLRAHWGLGVQPIRHLLDLLESRGVRVYGLAADPKSGHDPDSIEGLSTWFGSTPFMFLRAGNTAERMRMSAAHELAHLVLHRHGAPSGQIAERQANQFAGAFLVPRADLVANLPRPKSSVEAIIRAKHRWRVAAIAVVYRMHEEGFLNDWEYRQACIHIRSRFGNGEPEEIDRERSQVLTKVLSALWAEKSGRRHMARDLAVTEEEIEPLFRGLLGPPTFALGKSTEAAKISLLR